MNVSAENKLRKLLLDSKVAFKPPLKLKEESGDIEVYDANGFFLLRLGQEQLDKIVNAN